MRTSKVKGKKEAKRPATSKTKKPTQRKKPDEPQRSKQPVEPANGMYPHEADSNTVAGNNYSRTYFDTSTTALSALGTCIGNTPANLSHDSQQVASSSTTERNPSPLNALNGINNTSLYFESN